MAGVRRMARQRLRPGYPAALLLHSPHFVTASLVLLFICAPYESARAFEIEHSATHYRDKHYQFEFVALLDAPTDRVEAVLRDYERYPKLDPRILEARVLERPADYVVVLETIVRACFGPFCRNVKRVERVEESPRELAAVTDAARSDVRFGETRTMLSMSEGRTRVSYRTSVEPAFWIPRFVGRRWMLSTLEDATTALFMNVERRAKEEPKEESGESKEGHTQGYKEAGEQAGKEEQEAPGVAVESEAEPGSGESPY